jgi:hypothetical protein
MVCVEPLRELALVLIKKEGLTEAADGIRIPKHWSAISKSAFL